MESILAWFSSFGASIVNLVLGCVWFVGSAWIGFKVGERGRTWQGWIAGLVSLLLLGALFAPAMQSMVELSCKGAVEYDDCIYREGAYDTSD